MAGHARYTALLDANVLYPMAICDALMAVAVAVTGIYAPKWSAKIDEEWVRNLAKDKGFAEERFHVRRDLMHEACPDWEVQRPPGSGWSRPSNCPTAMTPMCWLRHWLGMPPASSRKTSRTFPPVCWSPSASPHCTRMSFCCTNSNSNLCSCCLRSNRCAPDLKTLCSRLRHLRAAWRRTDWCRPLLFSGKHSR